MALEGREKTAGTAEHSDRVLVDVNGVLEENRDARDLSNFYIEIYVQQVVYVVRRTGSGKLPLDVIRSLGASRW